MKDWSNNVNAAAFVPGSANLNLTGTTQTIGGSASTTFNNFNVNSAGTKTLGRSIVVNNNLLIG
ncbi:MAG: hypothetical protein ACK5QU_02230, partial [Bacteroidota bacterium]